MLKFFVIYHLILGAGGIVAAQGISTWASGKGPAVIQQNPLTGGFQYSITSVNGFSDLLDLNVTHIPKNGTPISSTGYLSGTTIYGGIFYQTINSSIAQVNMRCQFATGVCDPYKNAIISNNVSVPVSSNTGLAAAIFQQDQGYRVTYEDARGTIRQLAYANTTSGLLYQWEDGKAIGGLTSSDSHALSYTWTPYVPAQSQDTTVFQALNGTIRSVTSKIQLASTWAESGDGTWVNSSTIDNLPGWNATINTFATMVYGRLYMLFYIDNNRQLQFLQSNDTGRSWTLQPRMNSSVWPLADDPNATLGGAVSIGTPNTAWLMYTSGSNLVQVKMINNDWQPAAVVQAPPANSTIPAVIPKNPHKITLQVKAIIIVTSVGSSAFLAMILGSICWHRRKAKRNNFERLESTADSTGDARDSAHYEKPELEGSSDIKELDHDPECLLLHQLQKIRHFELRAPIPAELDGTLCRCEPGASVRYEMDAGLERAELSDDSIDHTYTTEQRRKSSCQGETSSLDGIAGSDCEEHQNKTATEDMPMPMSDTEPQELPPWAWERLGHEIERREREEQLQKSKAVSTVQGRGS